MKNPTLVACIVFGTLLSGCGGKTSTKEKSDFAGLYAEVLIAENMYKNDTARLRLVVDSILQKTEFESREEMKVWLEEFTASDPEGLQELMDSTQKYLERARDTNASK